MKNIHLAVFVAAQCALAWPAYAQYVPRATNSDGKCPGGTANQPSGLEDFVLYSNQTGTEASLCFRTRLSEVAMFGANYYPMSSHTMRQMDYGIREALRVQYGGGFRQRNSGNWWGNPFDGLTSAEMPIYIDRYKKEIEGDLDDLKLMGAKVIRVHVYDSEISDRYGNLYSMPNVPGFSQYLLRGNFHLDMLHYLMHQANSKGLTIHLTPISFWWSSTYQNDDAFARRISINAFILGQWERIPYAAGSNPSNIWDIQKNFMNQLMQSTNPYDPQARKLIQQPALKLIEILNEPVLIPFTTIRQWRDTKTSPNAADMAAPYFDTARGTNDSLDIVLKSFQAHVTASGKPFEQTTYDEFVYWRVRDYINGFYDQLRSLGATQPIGFSLHPVSYGNMPGEKQAYYWAVKDSKSEFIAFSHYDGDYLSNNQDAINFVTGYGVPTAVEELLMMPGKARVSYEFGTSGAVNSVYRIPLVARKQRRMGAQISAFFTYDPKIGASYNGADFGWGGPPQDEWGAHFLNLRHTPKQAVGFMQAAAIFASVPRPIHTGGYTRENALTDNYINSTYALSHAKNAAVFRDAKTYLETSGKEGTIAPQWSPFTAGASGVSKFVCAGSCRYWFTAFWPLDTSAQDGIVKAEVLYDTLGKAKVIKLQVFPKVKRRGNTIIAGSLTDSSQWATNLDPFWVSMGFTGSFVATAAEIRAMKIYKRDKITNQFVLYSQQVKADGGFDLEADNEYELRRQ